MARWNKREFDLATRAEKFDLELRQDDVGCYWLEHISLPDMHDIGPYDLDEAEDLITAYESGFSRKQTEEYLEDRRWERLHPEAE